MPNWKLNYKICTRKKVSDVEKKGLRREPNPTGIRVTGQLRILPGVRGTQITSTCVRVNSEKREWSGRKDLLPVSGQFETVKQKITRTNSNERVEDFPRLMVNVYKGQISLRRKGTTTNAG